MKVVGNPGDVPLNGAVPARRRKGMLTHFIASPDVKAEAPRTRLANSMGTMALRGRVREG